MHAFWRVLWAVSLNGAHLGMVRKISSSPHTSGLSKSLSRTVEMMTPQVVQGNWLHIARSQLIKHYLHQCIFVSKWGKFFSEFYLF